MQRLEELSPAWAAPKGAEPPLEGGSGMVEEADPPSSAAPAPGDPDTSTDASGRGEVDKQSSQVLDGVTVQQLQKSRNREMSHRLAVSIGATLAVLVVVAAVAWGVVWMRSRRRKTSGPGATQEVPSGDKSTILVRVTHRCMRNSSLERVPTGSGWHTAIIVPSRC